MHARRNTDSNSFSNLLGGLWLACLLTAPTTAIGQEPKHLVEWSTWNIQYLYGFNFDLGKDQRDTLTFEHADRWKYGDNFFFLNVINLAERDRTSADTELYSEWHTRLSLERIFDTNLSSGPINDILTAHGIDVGESTVAYLNGAGLSLNLPGFAFANVNAFLRDTVDQEGVTWHISIDWLIPITLADWHLSYGGFIDFTGEEGTLASNVLSETQLLLDVGAFIGHRAQLFLGLELQTWHNEFGIKGQHEIVPQMMAKWVF